MAVSTLTYLLDVMASSDDGNSARPRGTVQIRGSAVEPKDFLLLFLKLRMGSVNLTPAQVHIELILSPACSA
ncbi:hypothetical protein KSP40_PGU011525 [Platanthera guangdongensis]|uniref:Uncharacterized protein n=1 Tax=Platanthera guangdongensis TaxID=2320717 RepID=A0ABR2LPT6_9ASPA